VPRELESVVLDQEFVRGPIVGWIAVAVGAAGAWIGGTLAGVDSRGAGLGSLVLKQELIPREQGSGTTGAIVGD